MELAACANHGGEHNLMWLEHNNPKELGCELSCSNCNQPAHAKLGRIRAKSFAHNKGAAPCDLRAPRAEIIQGNGDGFGRGAGVVIDAIPRAVFNDLRTAEVHNAPGGDPLADPHGAIVVLAENGQGERTPTRNLRFLLANHMLDQGWLPADEFINVPDRAGPGQAAAVRPRDVFRVPEQLADDEINAHGHFYVWFEVTSVNVWPQDSPTHYYLNHNSDNGTTLFTLRLDYQAGEEIRRFHTEERRKRNPAARAWTFAGAHAIAFGPVLSRTVRAEIHLYDPRRCFFISP